MMEVRLACLVFSALQTNTNTFANSADPDETPYHPDRHFCHSAIDSELEESK